MSSQREPRASHGPRRLREPSRIRVLVADAHAAARAGFCLLVSSAPDMEVVGDAADGESVVALARSTAPDVVLMDTHLREPDGLEATRQITGDPALRNVRVLMLTIHDDEEHLFKSLAMGAAGFLPVDTQPAQLLEGIRATAAGASFLNPWHTQKVIERYVPRLYDGSAVNRPALAELSDREREVLALIGEGLTNSEIAQRLSLSPLTAKTYVSRIMAKLGARDRVQLALVAVESGIAAHACVPVAP
ncbi:two-component system response regulator [Streptomyces noursei ATCC 11455]|nr:two-component system response regulator [Streptomyces noursei ATCC 11455]